MQQTESADGNGWFMNKNIRKVNIKSITKNINAFNKESIKHIATIASR
ncbi:hypothetical protein QWY86_10490 [Pedobacter aquatilis]|nr:hypothetical protein [Pedobacter aquatilis]MDN3587097.1 hypothetical protein [Pedobacter aquatilis]